VFSEQQESSEAYQVHSRFCFCQEKKVQDTVDHIRALKYVYKPGRSKYVDWYTIAFGKVTHVIAESSFGRKVDIELGAQSFWTIKIFEWCLEERIVPAR
jgi:predicted nucleic acid-binding Zn finger protein